MAYRDPARGRAADRARFRKRTAQRKASGLCPRCGERRPEDGLAMCGACAEKRRASERARDARRRAAGVKRRRNPATERARDRRRIAERIARGLCTKCGTEPAEPARRLYAGCGEKHRAADRARYTEAKARGELYGGRDPGAKRKAARTASAKRRQARLDAGMCTRCGRRPPVDGGTVCGRCRDARRAAERGRYRGLRERGLCVTCGAPAFDGQSRCGVCATVEGERRDSAGKNDAARRRYAERRARNACTDCGQPAYGACRCPGCAQRSYERSAHFRGIPVWEPTFTVIELDTGTVHGPFDSEAEAAASLVFAKLSLHEVEIVSDAPITARVTGWS